MNPAHGPAATEPREETLTETGIPPIDAAVLAHLETATFALG